MPPRSRHAPPAADAASLDAEEYLDRCGVTAYMKDCVTLLLENRPDEPLTFMGDYFRTVTQPSSPLLRAYRYIRLAPIDRPPFPDNLVAAYAALDSQRGTNGVLGAELQRLLAVLCTDAGPIPALIPALALAPALTPTLAPTRSSAPTSLSTCRTRCSRPSASGTSIRSPSR